MTQRLEKLRQILPDTAEINAAGHLTIGGCDTIELANEFGTPLYVYDEATLRAKCREYIREFTERYANTRVIYACKAFINQALARLLNQEGLGLDVVSGGELFIARSTGFPMDKVYFHGNNKSQSELQLALESGIGRVVVDNFSELEILDDLARDYGKIQDVLLRLSPGIDPHTHTKTTTGIIDSKFGFAIATGQAEQALQQAMVAPNLNLVGLHVHLGSPIFEMEPYRQGIEVVLEFAARMKSAYGFELLEISPGGGFAIPYTRQSPNPSISEYAEAITSTLAERAGALGLGQPRLVIEPGRSIVGRAGTALYRSGAVKDIPGVRKYVSLDGGMSDNIRPALYEAQYEAVLAAKPGAPGTERVTLAGKHCESGDILIKDIDLPPIGRGEIIAIPVSGAYNLSMASNYNAALRPAVVMVTDGNARLIQRRESYQDLIERDITYGTPD